MERKMAACIFLALAVFLIPPVLSAESDFSPIEIKDASGGVYVEIRPEIELLAGVLSQTSWMKRMGPDGPGNEYFRDLQSFFARYKDHEAIILAERLTQRGFTYDAPPNFVLSLGPLPDLEPVNGYSQYLRTRAGGVNRLEAFRQELVKLAAESNFLRFYQEHRPYLEKVLISSTKGFDGRKILTWLQEFFGSKGDEYHLVLAPAFFPGGGYGATIETRDGKNIVYQIIREIGRSEDEPEFGDGHSMELLSLHEWGHSFVNPALGKYQGMVNDLVELFNPVKDKMEQMAYPDVEIFFNEQVLRAVVLLASKDLYGNLEYDQQLEYEIISGFYLTEFTVEQLNIYKNNRKKYQNFVQFVPYLLDQYDNHKKELIRLAEEYNSFQIKEAKVKAAYWAGDPRIRELTPRYPRSFLLEVEFSRRPGSYQQVVDFLRQAGLEFLLVAEGKPSIEARVYEGNFYNINNRISWGIWLMVPDPGYEKIERGVIYRLVHKKENPEYKWVFDEDVTLVLLEQVKFALIR